MTESCEALSEQAFGGVGENGPGPGPRREHKDHGYRKMGNKPCAVSMLRETLLDNPQPSRSYIAPLSVTINRVNSSVSPLRNREVDNYAVTGQSELKSEGQGLQDCPAAPRATPSLHREI